MDGLSFEEMVREVGFGVAVRVFAPRLTDGFFAGLTFAQCLEAMAAADSGTELRKRLERAAAENAENAAQCGELLKKILEAETKPIALSRLIALATCVSDCAPAAVNWPPVFRKEATDKAIELCASAADALVIYRWSLDAHDDAMRERAIENALRYAKTIEACISLVSERRDDPLNLAALQKALRLARSTDQCLAVTHRVPGLTRRLQSQGYAKALRVARTTDDCLRLVDHHVRASDAVLVRAFAFARTTADAIAIFEKLLDQIGLDPANAKLFLRAVRHALRVAKTTEERIAVLEACHPNRILLAPGRAAALAQTLDRATSIAEWKLVWDALNRCVNSSAAEERSLAASAALKFAGAANAPRLPAAAASS